jgi:hypothetical protein
MGVRPQRMKILAGVTPSASITEPVVITSASVPGAVAGDKKRSFHLSAKMRFVPNR